MGPFNILNLKLKSNLNLRLKKYELLGQITGIFDLLSGTHTFLSGC